jgi:hypothetical protein
LQVGSSPRGDGWEEGEGGKKKEKGLPPRRGEGIKKRRRGGTGRDGGGKEKERERERKGESQGEELIDTVIGGTARANARARRARAKCDRVCVHVGRVARLIAGFQFNNAIMRCSPPSLKSVYSPLSNSRIYSYSTDTSRDKNKKARKGRVKDREGWLAMIFIPAYRKRQVNINRPCATRRFFPDS